MKSAISYNRNNAISTPNLHQYYTYNDYNQEYYLPDQSISHLKSIHPQNMNWKKYLLPEVNEMYQQIIKRPKLTYQKLPPDFYKKYPQISKIGLIPPTLYQTPLKSQLTDHRKYKDSRLKDSKISSQYQDKIQILEGQNQSLKQQLYYLREALLKKFQKNQK